MQTQNITFWDPGNTIHNKIYNERSDKQHEKFSPDDLKSTENDPKLILQLTKNHYHRATGCNMT